MVRNISSDEHLVSKRITQSLVDLIVPTTSTIGTDQGSSHVFDVCHSQNMYSGQPLESVHVTPDEVNAVSGVPFNPVLSAVAA